MRHARARAACSITLLFTHLIACTVLFEILPVEVEGPSLIPPRDVNG